MIMSGSEAVYETVNVVFVSSGQSLRLMNIYKRQFTSSEVNNFL